MVRPECGDGEVIPGTLLSRTLTTHSQTWGVVGDNLDTDCYFLLRCSDFIGQGIMSTNIIFQRETCTQQAKLKIICFLF